MRPDGQRHAEMTVCASGASASQRKEMGRGVGHGMSIGHRGAQEKWKFRRRRAWRILVAACRIAQTAQDLHALVMP